MKKVDKKNERDIEKLCNKILMSTSKRSRNIDCFIPEEILFYESDDDNIPKKTEEYNINYDAKERNVDVLENNISVGNNKIEDPIYSLLNS